MTRGFKIILSVLSLSWTVANSMKILGTDVCLEDDGGSVTNNCIGCICEASTRCDTNVTCINNGFLCGPFYISKPFWIDAGRCVQPGDNPENPDAFLKCATDLACASRIVRSHMIAFGQDCSGDGLVTCDDYVMMHKNGGWSCRNPIQDTEFWGIYQECKNLIISRGENV